jgi:hypothetical protein
MSTVPSVEARTVITCTVVTPPPRSRPMKFHVPARGSAKSTDRNEVATL